MLSNKEQAEIKKIMGKNNTQELFDYAYALGWKKAMEKVLNEAKNFANK